MLLCLAESELLREDPVFGPGEGRLALLNATNGVYRAAEKVSPDAVAFLRDDGAQVFMPEEIDLAAEYLSGLQQPTIMQLLLHQMLLYCQLQAPPFYPTIESTETFRIVLRRLVDALIPVDHWRRLHSEVSSLDPCDSEVDESDSEVEEREPIDEPQQLDDDDAWLWNPFASNAVLVGLLEHLFGSSERTDDLVGLLYLLASIFHLGPTRCRASVPPATGSLLIKLYLERASDDSALTRTIGFTLSTWFYNSDTAKTQLVDANFMEHLDRIDLSRLNMPTMGLILQNWIHSDEVAQSKLLDSDTLRKMIDIISSLVMNVSLSGQEALTLYWICSVLLESHICKHKRGIRRAPDIWASLCDLLVISHNYPRLRFKCALLMRDMYSGAKLWDSSDLSLASEAKVRGNLSLSLASASSSTSKLESGMSNISLEEEDWDYPDMFPAPTREGKGKSGLFLTPAARSTCEVVCAFSKSEREREVFKALLPPTLVIHQSKPFSGRDYFDADLLDSRYLLCISIK